MRSRRGFRQKRIDDVIEVLEDEKSDLTKIMDEELSIRNQKTYDKMRMELSKIIEKLRWLNNTRDKMRKSFIMEE